MTTVAVAALLLLSALELTRAMDTCLDFYSTGQTPRCFSRRFPVLPTTQADVTHSLISRFGVLRDAVVAPVGFHIEELYSMLSTKDLGPINDPVTLLNKRTFRRGTGRRRDVVYDVDQLPADAQCCGRNLYLYTAVTVCANVGRSCSTSNVARAVTPLKCQQPCRSSGSGIVIPYSLDQRCPSCQAGATLPRCATVCKISCDDSNAAVNAVMSTACLGPAGAETTCRCPDVPPLSQTDLTYCVLDEYVARTGEIKFGNMLGVYIKKIQSVQSDVDFENDVADSYFCRVDAAVDLEFKKKFINTFVGTAVSGRTLAYFDGNVVKDCEFQNVLPGKFLSFRTGATLQNNIFGVIRVSPGSKIGFRTGRVCPTCPVRISENSFGSIVSPNGCQLNAGVPTPVISGNVADSTSFGSSAASCSQLNFP